MCIEFSMLNELQSSILVLNNDLDFIDVINLTEGSSKFIKEKLLNHNITKGAIFTGIDTKKIRNLKNNEFLRFESNTRFGNFEQNFVKIDRNKIILTLKKLDKILNKRKVTQLRNNFISSVNHEFRTPLNGIIGISNSFLVDENICSKFEQGLTIINKSGAKLLGLIEELLNFSEFESNNYSFYKEEVAIEDIISFCNGIMTNLTEEFCKEKREVTFEIQNDIKPKTKLINDEEILTEILSNILVNTANFTDSGVVKLKICENSQHYIFEFYSSNLKIVQNKMKIMMTKLLRDSIIERCKTTGVGLLAKSKFLTEIIGGSILVEEKNGKSKIVFLLRKDLPEDIINHKKLQLLKKNFIASVRSEFKIPLKRVEKISSSFMNEKKIEPEFQEGLKLIHESARRLTLLIVNLLDFSKLESGDFDIKYSKIKIKGVIHFINNKVKHLLKQDNTKKNKINFTVENNLNNEYEFISDQYIIKNILCNLLDNATKFTHSGNIIFKVFETSNKLKFEIHDSGIGISKSDMEYMFHSFKKGKSAHNFNGLGIGLSKSKLFAEYIQGEIDVESEQGTGTRVCFSLPKLLVKGEI